MYSRIVEKTINNKLGKGKAIILIGPKQVGKTTLIQNLLKDKKHLFIDRDNPTVRSLLTNPNTDNWPKQCLIHR